MAAKARFGRLWSAIRRGDALRDAGVPVRSVIPAKAGIHFRRWNKLSYGLSPAPALRPRSNFPHAPRSARGQLAKWRELARKLSPFDFFAHILEAEGGRKAFGARLGAECFDAIDEFLALAETFSARPQASLAEFVSFARKSASEVKRETDQAAREVRIMTVHGAKGLEANIVILADTCGTKSASPVPVYFLDDDSGAPAIPVWAVKGTGGLRPIANAKDTIKAGDQREQGRLLYVAMTRARDRLYIAGFHNGSLPAGSWYATIQSCPGARAPGSAGFPGPHRLADRPVAGGQRTGSERGQGGRRTASIVARGIRAKGTAAADPLALPDHGARRSRPGRLSRALARTAKRLRLAERLSIGFWRSCQLLPAEHRAKAAALIAAAFSGELAARQREEAAQHVLALLAKGALAQQAGHTLAEAGLAVTVRNAEGEHIASILGQADRIELSEAGPAVLDYKSGKPPSGRPGEARSSRPACLLQARPAAHLPGRRHTRRYLRHQLRQRQGGGRAGHRCCAQRGLGQAIIPIAASLCRSPALRGTAAAASFPRRREPM